jgi:hypothetical protein
MDYSRKIPVQKDWKGASGLYRQEENQEKLLHLSLSRESSSEGGDTIIRASSLPHVDYRS